MQEEIKELKNYRYNVVSSFLRNILQVEQSCAEKDAEKLLAVLSEDVLSKLVHFFDYVEQCTFKDDNNKTCKQGCSSCCGKCENSINSL